MNGADPGRAPELFPEVDFTQVELLVDRFGEPVLASAAPRNDGECQ